MADNYYPATGQRGGRKDSDNYAFVARVNDTLDAINKEQQLPSTSCRAVLFWNHAFVSWYESQRDSLIMNESYPSQDQPQGEFGGVFAHFLLVALDFSSDPMDYEVFGVKFGHTSSSFVKEYFAGVSPDNVVWFFPVELESEVEGNE